jgi:Carboxypeptidase regulatory-like domain
MGGLAEGGRRWALAVLVGCVALLILAPGAVAAEGTGRISGKVTAAVSHEELGHIEVFVYEAGGNEFPVGFAVTKADGEYTVEGLATGSYKVEFSPEFESNLNYVTQYYDGESSLAAANQVPVTDGNTTKEINAQLQVGGEIEGTVTDASTHKSLEGIEARAFAAGGGEFPVRSASTGKNGEYTIAGLVTGHYKVEFSPGFASSLNYITQYYDGKASLAVAESVEVVQEQVKTAVDAELQVGGEVTGTVTDASTHLAVANAGVAALGAGEAVEGIAITNASGQYTITGLASGSYKIGFVSSHYIVQYYNDQPSFASADPVLVAQGSTTAAIDAALVPKAPLNRVAPVASGAPEAGQALSCSPGSWTGSPAPTFSYEWLRDGVAIAGATGNAYAVQPADQGNGLTCKVTATNKNGKAAAVSNTLIVPVPPPPVLAPIVELPASKLVVSGSSVRVPLLCVGATCTGTIELSGRVVVKHRKGRRTISKQQTVALAKGSYSLAAGSSATIAIRLTAAGKRALAQAKSHRLSVKAVVTVMGGPTVRSSLVLSEAPPAKHGHKSKHKHK